MSCRSRSCCLPGMNRLAMMRPRKVRPSQPHRRQRRPEWSAGRRRRGAADRATAGPPRANRAPRTEASPAGREASPPWASRRRPTSQQQPPPSVPTVFRPPRRFRSHSLSRSPGRFQSPFQSESPAGRHPRWRFRSPSSSTVPNSAMENVARGRPGELSSVPLQSRPVSARSYLDTVLSPRRGKPAAQPAKKYP